MKQSGLETGEEWGALTPRGLFCARRLAGLYRLARLRSTRRVPRSEELVHGGRVHLADLLLRFVVARDDLVSGQAALAELAESFSDILIVLTE